MKAPSILVTSLAGLFLGMGHASAASCSQEIMDVTKTLAGQDAGSGPTSGTPSASAGDEKGQHPATSLIGKETAGKATSAEDVRRQSGLKTAAGEALERARSLVAQGKEKECMDEVNNARQLAGR
ncbi:MAG TPA: hypothetical protein VKF35_19685 [Hyphomicrobiaceae bacterium]|nr:hypothetical protein [Hyphomicrobiaceae bacterium]